MASTSSKKYSILPGFTRCSGEKKFTGLNGLNTLLRHLRSDVKDILVKYDITPPSKQWKELQQLINPYRKDWNTFSRSGICPFNKKELIVIKYCRTYDNLSVTARDTGYSYYSVSQTLNTVIKRLTYPAFVSNSFNKWEEYQNDNLESPGIFLSAPLEVHRGKMSHYLFSTLSTFGKNMEEILTVVTMKKLKNCRGFGKEKEKELNVLLCKYNCDKLLNKF